MAVQRTALTRLGELVSTDRAALDALLDEVWLGQVGMVRSDAPAVFPTAVARWHDRLLAQGSTGAPWMRSIASRAEICVSVCAVDGLVVARSAFESSVQYRSAVLYGFCDVLVGAEKLAALDVIADRLLPGRVTDLRRPTAKELAATMVLALPIEEWSLKISADSPEDPPEDIAGDAWAGVVEIGTWHGDASPAPDLRPGTAVPGSVTGLRNRRQSASDQSAETTG